MVHGIATITLRNDFHNTEVNTRIRDTRLTRRQLDRIRRSLCGIKGCTCGDSLGSRGPQDDPESVELLRAAADEIRCHGTAEVLVPIVPDKLRAR